MNMEETYRLVENILKEFPAEYRKNYEQNKKDAVIKKQKNMPFGEYNYDENIITICTEESLLYGLFSMAFRDRDKISVELFDDVDLIYDNGVSYYNGLLETKNGQALNEGFIEYLSRKCFSVKKYKLEYYFVNLLIKIHGEEILKYPLTNDSLNFYQDSRFNYIQNIRVELDNLMESEQRFKTISYFYDALIENLKDNKDVRKSFENIQQVKINYLESIIKLFELIILEYKNCLNSKISLDSFIELLNDFLINKDYEIAFQLAKMDNYPFREKIEDIIKKFKSEYVKEKMK